MNDSIFSLQSARKGPSYVTMWSNRLDPYDSTKISEGCSSCLAQKDSKLLVGDSQGVIHTLDSSLNHRGSMDNTIEGITSVLPTAIPLVLSHNRVKPALIADSAGILSSLFSLLFWGIIIAFVFGLTQVDRN